MGIFQLQKIVYFVCFTREGGFPGKSMFQKIGMHWRSVYLGSKSDFRPTNSCCFATLHFFDCLYAFLFAQMW